MHTAEDKETRANLTEQDRAMVLQQLSRLLDSPLFRNSRRYPMLLRFIVEETLEGRGDLLKERLLGIQLFDRPADYDTAADPIVRVTIAEVRKRIAQYYHSEEHDAEVRIELMPGRYAPEFRARRDTHLPAAAELAAPAPIVLLAATEAVPPADPAERPGPEPLQPGRRPWWRSPVLWSLAALLLVVAGAGLRWLLQPTALEELWGPVLSSKGSVLFCVPLGAGNKPLETSVAPADTARNPSFLDYESLGENVVYSDMLAMLRVISILDARHRDYRVLLVPRTSLDDLRHGPTVLIGGLDNRWTMLATASLPYRFAGSDADRYWIQNASNPEDRSWSLDLKQKITAVTRDYALVARVHNEQTGEPEMIIAGIGMSGTAAAGEMVTIDAHIRELRDRLGPAFRDHDFEVVISTDVVNGVAGSPRILAVSKL